MDRPTVVLIHFPPLLAGIIHHVLTEQLGATRIADVTDPVPDFENIRAMAPDLVLLGPLTAIPLARLRAGLPASFVLAISRDLKDLLGPGDDDVVAFALDSLIRRIILLG